MEALRHARSHWRRLSQQITATSRRQDASFAYEPPYAPTRVWNFRRVRDWYSEQLDERPIVTKAITAGIIAGLGDLFIQFYQLNYEKGHDSSAYHGQSQNDGNSHVKAYTLTNLDSARTMRFVVLGAFFAAPFNHYWYQWLAGHLPGQAFGRITQRVIMDQLLCAPIFDALWLLGLWRMEGNTLSQSKEKLISHFPSVLAVNWLMWIPAQYANFFFVPLKFQVLYITVVELAWNAFLSLYVTEKAGSGGGHGS